MRKLVLALAAVATLGAMSVAADAMPAVGAAAVAPSVGTPAVEKTVVVVRRRAVRKVCKTVVTAGRRVTKCVTR